MSFNMVLGLAVTSLSIITSSILVFISTKRINIISEKKLSGLREINREFSNAEKR